VRLAVTLAIFLAAILLATRFVAVPWVVAGPSMEPTLEPGDHVVVDLWTYRRRDPREGEIALLDSPWGGPIVKRVARRLPSGERYRVLGDNPANSTDSRMFGTVERGRFRGRIVWRYWPLSRAGRIR
jgi:nickel-type superoxide dismutase maturation protease